MEGSEHRENASWPRGPTPREGGRPGALSPFLLLGLVGTHLPDPGKTIISLTSLSLAYPLGEAGEAVTKPGKAGGTVGRKKADCGIGVGPGQLQTGPHHGQKVGAPSRQCLL